MRIYLIIEDYDNGESYEDWDHEKNVIGVALTEQKAKEFIANINPGDKYGNEWTETKASYGCERTFCDDIYCDGRFAYLCYIIKEMEVLE